MNNMLGYVQNNMKRFEEMPFSEIDSMVLSWISYLAFPSEIFEGKKRVYIRDAFLAEHFNEMVYGVLSPDDTIQLLAALSASPRFRNMELIDYENVLDYETSTQFAAITFKLTRDLYYIAFRGTDGTLIGWKEDFDMTLGGPVMAQSMAKDYLERFARSHRGALFIGGHSKGGNMAVYAAANARKNIRSRIIRIYSHDGPGFPAEELKGKGFADVREKISKTIPQSSLVGLTFEQECEYKIVKSNTLFVRQHNLFSWEIDNNELVTSSELTPDAKRIYKALNTWLNGMEMDERRELIDVVFGMLEETGTSDFTEFVTNWKANFHVVTKSFRSLDKEKREFLHGAIKDFAACVVKAEKKDE